MPPLFIGVRPQPQMITRWAICDIAAPTEEPMFFGGFPIECNYDEEPLGRQIAIWTAIPRFRREYDDYEEAVLDAAILIEMGILTKERIIEVVKVSYF